MKAFIQDLAYLFKKDSFYEDRRLLAHKNRWKYAGRSQFIKHLDFDDLELFKGKKAKRKKGVLLYQIHGLRGYFQIYDYVHYGDFRNKPTTVFQYEDGRLDLSQFIIRPKKKFNAFKELFVSSDHFFATTPEFDEYYEIIAEKDKIKKELNEDFLDLIGDVPGWTIEGKGKHLELYQKGNRLEIDDLVKEGKRFEQICIQLIFGKSVS